MKGKTMSLHNTQPNGRLHALALHPISSTTHKATSETAKRTYFKCGKQRRTTYNNGLFLPSKQSPEECN